MLQRDPAEDGNRGAGRYSLGWEIGGFCWLRKLVEFRIDPVFLVFVFAGDTSTLVGETRVFVGAASILLVKWSFLLVRPVFLLVEDSFFLFCL